jgi:GTPase SAR1 family protein
MVTDANDVSRNETKNCITTLKSRLSALTSTNVVVLNIPTRYDLIKESVVNKEVKKANMVINKVCRRFRNVKVLDISNISRAWHTRHGQHLNKIGKEHISEEISKIIGKTEKNRFTLQRRMPFRYARDLNHMPPSCVSDTYRAALSLSSYLELLFLT